MGLNAFKCHCLYLFKKKIKPYENDEGENNSSNNFLGIVRNPNLQNNLLNRNLTEIIILLKAKIVKSKKDYLKDKDKKLCKNYSSKLKGDEDAKKN